MTTRIAPPREAQAARQRLRRTSAALDETRTFLAGIRSDGEGGDDHRRHVSVLHALDHLQGAAALLGSGTAAHRLARAPELVELRDLLRTALAAAEAWCPLHAPEGPADHILGLFQRFTPARRQARMRVLRRVAIGEIDPDAAEGSLESLMWAQQFAHHVERTVHHLREPAPGDES